MHVAFAGQVVHSGAPSALYFPAGHTQADAEVDPDGLVFPPVQAVHDDPFKYLFAGHTQADTEVDPVSIVVEPAGQVVHGGPALIEYVPIGHGSTGTG